MEYNKNYCFITLILVLISNFAFAQVGIGTINPDATLHVVGTTVLPSGGGTVTLYSNDFTSGGVIYNTGAGNTCSTAPNIWNIDTTEPLGVDCLDCTGNFAMIEYSSSCAQNQTLIEGSFTPITTTVNISFDYGYDDGGASDDFIVTLYNESTASVAATLLSLTVDADNATYSGSHTVLAGQNYSLRFQYIGDDDWGAAVDNILIEETTTSTGTGSYAFRLEDGQQQDGYVMTSDANGYATWKVASGGSGGGDQTLSITGNDLTISGPGGNTVTLPTGSGGTYTFDNGLTEASSTVKLGGTLIEDTSIDLDDNDFTISTTDTSIIQGNFVISGGNRQLFSSDIRGNYAVFGTSTFFSSTAGSAIDGFYDGASFDDSGSNTFTADVLVGYYRGEEGGSALKAGSIEYIVDGLDELLVRASSLNPFIDNSYSLGYFGKRWSDVYAVNGTINTSDIRKKKNIEPLDYGLKEILKLKPITFKWKENKKGNTIISENLQETKIGFSAQQLLEVIPEVVKTHGWKPIDEKGNYKRVKSDVLGVYYSDIIPVTVKAIQEQQKQIGTLKAAVDELKEQNRLLKQLIESRN